MWPAKKAKSALPTDPAMPPIPTTAPTALRGNMSDDVVKRLADQPLWAPAAPALPVVGAAGAADQRDGAAQRHETCSRADGNTQGSADEHRCKPRVVGREAEPT